MKVYLSYCHSKSNKFSPYDISVEDSYKNAVKSCADDLVHYYDSINQNVPRNLFSNNHKIEALNMFAIQYDDAEYQIAELDSLYSDFSTNETESVEIVDVSNETAQETNYWNPINWFWS